MQERRHRARVPANMAGIARVKRTRSRLAKRIDKVVLRQTQSAVRSLQRCAGSVDA
jgi:hypothetical protein